MTERYHSVNGAWPEVIPALSAQEAASAGRRLYRLAMGKRFRGKVKITSGNRHTWVRRGVMSINPNGEHFGGWKDLVHDLSHYCHQRLYPNHRPHDGQGTHAFIEKTMIEYVVNSGWLEGKLKRPEKPKENIRTLRHQQVLKRIAAWESKRKRAENALRKLRKQQSYYERSL